MNDIGTSLRSGAVGRLMVESPKPLWIDGSRGGWCDLSMVSLLTMLGSACTAVCLFAPFAGFGEITWFPNLRYVVHISADGLGGVYLSNYLAHTPGEFPAFQRLKTEGAGTLNARCDFHNSVTEPNHASMFTGRPVSQQPTNVLFSAPHSLTFNYDPGAPWTLHTVGNLAMPYKTSVFDVAHDHGLGTAFFAGKVKFDLFIRSYDAANGGSDLRGEDNGTCKIDFSVIRDYTDGLVFLEQSSNLVTIATNRLATALPRYTFLHLADLDIAGHYYGWGSQTYRDVARHVDAQLGRVFAAIENNAVMRGHTAIVLTADHGGGDIYGSHIVASDWRVFTIPLLVWGPGVAAGQDLYALFSNRSDPGGQYLDYDAPGQPLRNGDSGNIALALLGLPPVPGSCLVPEFRPWLTIRQTEAGVIVSWPAADSPADLEWSDVASGGTWSKITQGIVRENGGHTYRVPNDPSTPPRFFRLSWAATR